MVPESRLESTEHGLVPQGEGWFVLNAREARWYHGPGAPPSASSRVSSRASRTSCSWGSTSASSGRASRWRCTTGRSDQEDFLVLAGEALLIVERDKRPLRQWDLVHCPAGTKHVIVGAGEAPCLVLESAPATARLAQTGAVTAWTRPQCATARGSSRRRSTRSRRTRDSPSANQPGTARAGFPNRCWTRTSRGRVFKNVP